jgi:outer membrane protein OmpA-like peptidoglycan-associated protein
MRWTFAALVTSVAVAAAGCGGVLGGSDDSGGGGAEKDGNGASGPPPKRDGRVIASAPVASGEGKARVELLSVDRGNANSVTVRYRVVNEASQAQNIGFKFSAEGGSAADREAHGVTLVDLVTNRRYLPLTGSDGKCLCTNVNNISIEPGRSHEMFAILPAPPPQVNAVTVAMPLAPAFTGVPIGGGPAPAVPGGVDPAKAQLGPRKILPLNIMVEGQDRSLGERGDEQQVRLSSDVLFALNKADLTPQAKGVLTDVAKRIDASPGNTVKIDGHTDNTGNDAINDPLSLRRAQAVEQELKALGFRPGVTYQSAGHGSKQPAFSNDTESGRKKNRRVVVAYTRPRPPAPPPTSASTPAAPQAAPVATAQPQAPEVQPVKAVVNSLTRDPSGMAQLTWTLTNTGAIQYQVSGFESNEASTTHWADLPYHYQGGTTPGVTLYDENSGLRYFSLLDSENYCICTAGGDPYTVRLFLKPNESVSFFNLFKLPPEVRSIGVEIPSYVPIKDVQVR